MGLLEHVLDKGGVLVGRADDGEDAVAAGNFVVGEPVAVGLGQARVVFLDVFDS